ncbi:rhoGEF domain-containing protein [Naegleria gruberi]|uniref:RhoGEF domain-containing protein n=1 Tax=Naegleria gruberi TaxID=5762 RepID=D2VX75_NAEGR|nr:rhoGEF domain-containing protein [Naegleria gruberi]EFC38629.1 rhoGEF domain-containing protein [Naegleria gruberi]|eukprot:XP_002671373.1 rhoGEF domain-containing protein [Naegleria gruberi strain NEG-M]
MLKNNTSSSNLSRKKVRFEISTQIDELDFETLEMRNGPFGNPRRSIRKDFDTTDSVNQTDDDHYSVPRPYEFVNSINTSTVPRALKQYKTNKKEQKKQRMYINKNKYDITDTKELREMYKELKQPVEEEKLDTIPEVAKTEKSEFKNSDNDLIDGGKNTWKRLSISYGNLTANVDDFDSTATDSINYSDSESDSDTETQIVNYGESETANEEANKESRRPSSGDLDYKQLAAESHSIDQPIAVHKNLKQIFDGITDREGAFRQNHNPTPISSKTQAVYFRYNILSQVPIQSLVEGGNITLLDISNNYISSIPTWFATTLKSLTYLFLPYNYLYELPENFCEMKKLKELDLSNNNFEYVPGCILKLPNILTLDLSGNSLLIFPNDISLLKNTLTDLNISGNELREVPDDIRQLKKLKYFKYNDNDLFYYTTSLILSKLNTEEDLRIKSKNRRKSVKATNYLFGGGVSESLGEEDSPEIKKINEQYQKNIPNRQVLLLQLLNSETEYISHMNVFNDILFEPLLDICKNRNEFNISNSERDCVLPSVILDIIGNARGLYIDLKSKLLPLTQARSMKNEDSIEISKVFETRLEEFRQLYVKYPSVYENAAAVLNKLRKTNEEFDKYIKLRKRLPICSGHIYDAYLLLPVTRLFIYLKFLQKILRYTPDSHPDFKNLRIVVRELRHIVQEQEEYIYRINNKYKVLEIEKKLKMNESLLKPGRFFLKEGRLILGQNKGINNFKKDVMNKLYNKGTISEIRGQVTPYWDAVKNKTIEDLLELRFTELYVQVYLMSDVVIIKETNFVQKLVSRFNLYPLKGASVVMGTDEAAFEMDQLSPGRDFPPIEIDQSIADKEEKEKWSINDKYKGERQFTLIINTPSKRIPLGFICETKEECLDWFKEIEKALTIINNDSATQPTEEKTFEEEYEIVEPFTNYSSKY